MLHEAARLVREGGFVVFTTLAPRDEVLPAGFPSTWRADAKAGQFVYMPTGGAHQSLIPSVYGWSLLSEPYLRRIAAYFPLTLAAYDSDRLMQAFVALRKQ
jgi:hypothetical protein